MRAAPWTDQQTGSETLVEDDQHVIGENESSPNESSPNESSPNEIGRVATGWPQIDRALGGGLAPGVLHEWFAGESSSRAGRSSGRRASVGDRMAGSRAGVGGAAPPLLLLTHIADCALQQAPRHPHVGHQHVVWIGKAAWPHAACFDARDREHDHISEEGFEESPEERLDGGAGRTGAAGCEVDALLRACPAHAQSWIYGVGSEQAGLESTRSVQTAGRVLDSGRTAARLPDVGPQAAGSRAAGSRAVDLMAASIFIDPPDDRSRLWAIDLCLRSPAVAVVVADGHGLTMASSRRLQLAARAGNTLALITRPASERNALSAASSRWHVHRTLAVSPHAGNRDGTRGAGASHPRWMLELLRCKGRARGDAIAAAPQAAPAPATSELAATAMATSELAATAMSEIASSQTAGSKTDGAEMAASESESTGSRLAQARGVLSEYARAAADFYVPSADTQRWWVEWHGATGIVRELSELVSRATRTPRAAGVRPGARARPRAAQARITGAESDRIGPESTDIRESWDTRAWVDAARA